MRRAVAITAAAACLWLTGAGALPLAAWAQQAAATQSDGPALLIADDVVVEQDNRLVATGNVEALFDGSTLRARQITYDPDGDRLLIEGPIRITYPDGTILLSDAAELDQGFRNGLLRGARMVLDEQLQLAAVEARRVDGRYTQLSRVAVTSCQICGKSGLPLWQIRASRVVHDQQERQIYFDDAQLRFFDVPVFYLPRLRLPDPTLDRAPGFLIPELRSSTLLGFGIKAPYFLPLGDHADITFTPYLSTVTRTVEYRYRQAFRTGDLVVRGAVSQDTLQRDTTRAYLFADGSFALPQGFRLRFDIELVSDAAYLSDYDYSDKDRLDSQLGVSRIRRDEYIAAELNHFESLIATENNATQPTLVADVNYERRFRPARLGGELRLAVMAHGHYRYSDADILGRDVARLTASAAWLQRWTLPGGLRAGAEFQLMADRFGIRQDSASDARVSRLTPAARVELRWPLVRGGPGGTRQLIEPLAQIGWTGGTRPALPNDESTRVEFDEGNLLSLSRFPAADRREHGLTGALGLRWVRSSDTGWNSGLTLGRVWREDADPEFAPSTGLSGTRSSWLIAGYFRNQRGLGLTARGVVRDDLSIARAEARGTWSRGPLDLSATYILLSADPAEGRLKSLSEWNFDGSYDFAPDWTVSANWRYDLADDRFARAGLGLAYRNECIDVGFSVSRRFGSSTNVEPSTTFGLTVALKGFGTAGSDRDYRRSCG